MQRTETVKAAFGKGRPAGRLGPPDDKAADRAVPIGATQCSRLGDTQAGGRAQGEEADPHTQPPLMGGTRARWGRWRSPAHSRTPEPAPGGQGKVITGLCTG